MFPADAAVFLADFGVPVVAGAQSALAILDRPDENVLGDRQITTDYAITYATADLALAHGQTITVGGTSYVVREVRVIDDGRFATAMLKR